jgi:hypothetical protein
LAYKTYRYLDDDDYLSAKCAYVGLATPGDVGSWQRECKVCDLKNRNICYSMK